MWGLDADGDAGIERAQDQYMDLVLEPQREGGGNNIYKSSIPSFLVTLPISERRVWIAMELIQLPKPMRSRLIRAGGAAEGAIQSEVVSESRIFGRALFGGSRKKGTGKGGECIRAGARERMVLEDERNG